MSTDESPSLSAKLKPVNQEESEETFAELIDHYFPPVREPRIVTEWLIQLRWIASIGQIGATLAAHFLGLNAPFLPVAIVAAVTAITNISALKYLKKYEPPTAAITSILLLDMCLLTYLLYETGGTQNPFSTLYLVHVAMAVTTLGGMWTWIVLMTAAIEYGILFFVNPRPLYPAESPALHHFGLWCNLLLIGGLITYFASRVNRALKRRDLQVSSLREKNARHEKLSTLTTLAAGAAHELGTPLATIAVVAKELELAISKIPDHAILIEDTQLIRQECNRCRFILDRMRVDVASDTRNITTTIEELMIQLARHLREDEKERIDITGPQEGYSISASCPAIEQSLTVMIRNAFDASPENSRLKMVIRKLKTSVAFDVIDKGHGMPEEVLKRAGDPFFTTKVPGRGMGLGLFLVRLVAENFRGQFKLASKPGEGTTCTLELPLG